MSTADMKKNNSALETKPFSEIVCLTRDLYNQFLETEISLV